MVGVRAITWFHLIVLLLVSAGCGASSPPVKKVLRLHKLKPAAEVKPSTKCLPQRSRRVNDATVLEIKHHSYCSDPIQKPEDRAWKLLISDNARASSLQSKMANTRFDSTRKDFSEVQLPLVSGAKLQTLNYIVTVELGGNQMTVIMDTGSDLTWVQCLPCASCYNQQDPLFNPTASTSYQSIPCNTTTCNTMQQEIGIPGACEDEQLSCIYDVSYGDGSFSHGVLAQDQINLAGTTMPHFVFGCGQSNQGLFGGTSGLMGLGRSQISLVSQTTAQFGGVFSYCLPSRDYDSSGSLIFGSDSSAYRNSSPIVYTKLISDPDQIPFYLLNLTGMSIGGISLQSSAFTDSNVLIDSGTVISRVAPSVYKVLKAEFMKQFSGYPSAPGFSILDICFNLSGYKEVNIPTVKLEFEGSVEVEVDVSGVLYFVKQDASQACLAFASLSYEYETGIIGNYQQKNLRVVYDINGSRLGFATENCDYI